jgi:uncharacterized damage-inducible protein DinB
VSADLRHLLRPLAAYHRWATARLLDAVAAMPDADYRRPAGLFFGSVHGTLNHLLVAEAEVWWPRFALGENPRIALDAEVEPDRAALASRLLEAAGRWLPALDGWSDERLAGRLHYRRLSGEPMDLPFAPTLAHVFNHGTHHRGQVTAALTAMGRPAPVLDLVYHLQDSAR